MVRQVLRIVGASRVFEAVQALGSREQLRQWKDWTGVLAHTPAFRMAVISGVAAGMLTNGGTSVHHVVEFSPRRHWTFRAPAFATPSGAPLDTRATAQQVVPAANAPLGNQAVRSDDPGAIPSLDDSGLPVDEELKQALIDLDQQADLDHAEAKRREGLGHGQDSLAGNPPAPRPDDQPPAATPDAAPSTQQVPSTPALQVPLPADAASPPAATQTTHDTQTISTPTASELPPQAAPAGSQAATPEPPLPT